MEMAPTERHRSRPGRAIEKAGTIAPSGYRTAVCGQYSARDDTRG